MKAVDSIPTMMPDVEPTELAIEGVTEPVLLRYFATLNASDFEATSRLFAADGELHAPFESPVVGPAAIASYLQAEAQGMKLYPRYGIAEPLEDSQTQIHVTGKVQTPLFGVNVAWLFVLNPEREILSVTVKLLASLQELVHLRR